MTGDARFGVYVHFPYCLSKCPYCDFASTAAATIPQERYTNAVVQELAARVAAGGLAQRAVDSVYVGGGTPSLWWPEQVGRVLSAIASTFRVAAGAEITIEANPGASDAQRFGALRALGINRLSLGVQSFEAQTLAALGRAHDASAAVAAFEAAREAGFSNVSMDFIYGVQGQTEAMVERDARRAVALGPEHVSAYALTLDAESLAEEVPLAKKLKRGEVALPADESVLRMQRVISSVWGEAGLARYEVSNYARPLFHSRHNALYWTGGEYLALGAGATGFLRGPHGPRRFSNHRSADRYMCDVESGRLPHATEERLRPSELFAERIALGLRMVSGVDIEGVCEEFGEDPKPRMAYAEGLIAGRFAAWQGRSLALTPEGFDVHSFIASRLM